MKKKSIHARIAEIKKEEQIMLIDALRKYGEPVDGGYEVHFVSDMPFVAGYVDVCYTPCDIAIYSARVDDRGCLELIGLPTDEFEAELSRISPRWLFAGQLETVRDTILSTFKKE